MFSIARWLSRLFAVQSSTPKDEVARVTRPGDTLALALLGHRIAADVVRFSEARCSAHVTAWTPGLCRGRHILFGGASILALNPRPGGWERTSDVDYKFGVNTYDEVEFSDDDQVAILKHAVEVTAFAFAASEVAHSLGDRLERLGYKAPGRPVARVFSVVYNSWRLSYEHFRICVETSSRLGERVNVFELMFSRHSNVLFMGNSTVVVGGERVPLMHPLTIFFRHVEIAVSDCWRDGRDAKSLQRLRRMHHMLRAFDATWLLTYDNSTDIEQDMQKPFARAMFFSLHPGVPAKAALFRVLRTADRHCRKARTMDFEL